jgi:hypothetical protein
MFELCLWAFTAGMLLFAAGSWYRDHKRLQKLRVEYQSLEHSTRIVDAIHDQEVGMLRERIKRLHETRNVWVLPERRPN